MGRSGLAGLDMGGAGRSSGAICADTAAGSYVSIKTEGVGYIDHDKQIRSRQANQTMTSELVAATNRSFTSAAQPDGSREQDAFIQPDDPGRPNVLVIAGYDQSGGAGVLSDVKTMEVHGVYAYAVCTGLTFQNERVITKVQWFTEQEIFEQIDL